MSLEFVNGEIASEPFPIHGAQFREIYFSMHILG